MSIITTPLDPGFHMQLRSGSRAEDALLAGHIESIWQDEQARRNGALHNGSMLSLDVFDGSTFWVHVTDYRHFIAQLRAPELREAMPLRVLGVSGILRLNDAVYFGQRSATTTQSPSVWELVPSGGLTRDAIRADGSVDVIQQLLLELEEEVGLSRTSVTRATAFVMVEDTTDGVVDIGIDVQLDSFRPLSPRSDEYDAILPVRLAELDAFLEAHPIVPTSRALLAACHALRGQ